MHATQSLMLHFDVNKTLILKDSSKNVEPEEMIISLLAEFTVGQWDNIHGPMSYKHYVENILLQDSCGTPHLKAKRTQKIGEFLNFLEIQSHPLKDEVFAKRDELRRKFFDPEIQAIKFTVFQSFYELIKHLKAINMHFTVLLRTFGNDLPEVVKEIEEHPMGIKITRKAAFINRQLHLENSTVEGVDKIFEAFVKSDEHFAVQDNYKEWHASNGHASYGKPFIYDASGKAHNISNVSLFFDDNFSGNEHDIINPIEVSGKNVSGNALKGKLLFTVNPIEAVLHDDYYIKLVNQAISNAN